MKKIRTAVSAALLSLGLGVAPVSAAQTNVAVAANFTGAAKDIAAAFKTRTGHDAVLSFGSSGQLYTQITQSAPFDILLSADDTRPKKLAEDGFGVPSSRFTYAVGKLSLWSRTAGRVTGEKTLEAGDFSKLSIANPTAAPYGAAAIEVMKSLNVYDRLKPKIVQGSSIAQAFQFVDTGNAELGFVAKAQIAGKDAGSSWSVPQHLYTPIRQDAILLKKSEGNAAATAFMSFLKSPEAKAIIEKFGYGVEGAS